MQSITSTGRFNQLILVATSAILLIGVFLLSELAGAAPSQFEIAVLSSRADSTSGGDALLQIRVPASTSTDDVLIRLNGHDVSAAFRAVDGLTLQGLLTGMSTGINAIAVGPRSTGQVLAKIPVFSYPISGPLFSGAHQVPFICVTQDFVLPTTGGTLGLPLDPECSAPTRIDYVYHSSNGTFKALPDPTVRPADLTQTTTQDGTTVNYIVRVETGTINRGIYQIALLHDPQVDRAPDPWTTPAGWNRRLIYAFGPGCSATYNQGVPTVSVLMPQLGMGYAIATSSLNAFGNDCNDVRSAETMSMVKEHFIEHYGLPTWTMGFGGSGGSMAQHLIAENYPGLLDGIVPQISFPDAMSMFAPVEDCALLTNAFNGATQFWTPEQKTAVSGYANFSICGSPGWTSAGFAPGAIDPYGCPAVVPVALRYDPVANPEGARCSVHDNMLNVFGADPVTGFARRPWDNVGVQYGLGAFNVGTITAEQFVELNERAGGFDVDGNIVSARSTADDEALRIAYQTGKVNGGGGGLASIPIIDARSYFETQLSSPAVIHDRVRSFSMRQRLIATNGNADNHVIFINGPTGTQAVPDAIGIMAQWMDNIAADVAPATRQATRVLRNKPAAAVDTCYTAAGQIIVEPATLSGAGLCNQMYPSHADPRMVAGESVAMDVLKCQLKPLDASDYPRPITSTQWQRLAAVFPIGVCDYSRPGVEQQPIVDTWLRYPTSGVFVRMGD